MSAHTVRLAKSPSVTPEERRRRLHVVYSFLLSLTDKTADSYDPDRETLAVELTALAVHTEADVADSNTKIRTGQDCPARFP